LQLAIVLGLGLITESDAGGAKRQVLARFAVFGGLKHQP